MNLDLDRIRAHADDRLAETPPGREGLGAFRRLLKLETDRLRMRHRLGLGGREIARGRSYLVDIVLARVFRSAAAELGAAAQAKLADCAIVAVGGYGRRELAPSSDVDLLVLRPGRASSELVELVGKVLPMLWDVGLQVGHSFRSTAECVAIARDDLHARNAMSDARLVAGSGELFHQFQGQMDAAIYRNAGATAAFLTQMRGELQERLTRFGEAVCMQEPNVKEGAGGLRDVHTVGWIAYALLGSGDVDRLHDLGYVEAAEHTRMRQAYDFLSRVRNELHFGTGRKTDVLSLELQPAVAEALSYQPQGGLAASERFMRDYYRAAQVLRRFNETFLMRTGTLDPPEPLLAFRRRGRPAGPAGRFALKRGKLYARPGARPVERATDLLAVFELVQEEGAPLSDELAHTVRARLGLIDRRFRASPDAARRFLALLGAPGRAGLVLRAMHDTGFLGRYLPPFQRIALLVQHDHYHRYTVDEHTLRAVEAIDALAAPPHADATPEPAESPPALLAAALRDVRDLGVLVLGVLFHDVGKGRGGGHVAHGARLARQLAERLGLDPAATADVVFLVQKHLVMSQVSQRRDLSDPQVVGGFAETVETLDRLRMLFLLTYADTQAVGPGTWTDWKASLLAKLYVRTRASLTAGDLPPSDADRRLRLEDKVVAHLMPEYLRRDVEAFLGALPERYLRALPAEVIARHLRMAQTLGSQTVLTDWMPIDHGRHTLLSVCLRDAPGVLARLAGTLTGAGFDILAVEAFTRADGIVLDVFTLAGPVGAEPSDAERWAAVDANLTAALEGRYAVDAAVARRWSQLSWGRRRRAPRPPQVRFEPPDPMGRTVVEVRADDQPGLVYRITDCLSALQLDISFAKIATEKSQALDRFFVTRADGAPVPPDDTPRIEAALLAALTRPGPRSG